MPGKRVLMLLSNPFRPDPRVHREALALVKAGYRVTIVCWDREGKHPARENIDGIDIRRVGPGSSFGSTLTFLRALPGFWRRARKAVKNENFDIIHTHDLDTLAPAVKEARQRKIPLIYDSHELYHEMAAERLPRFLVGLVASYEARLVRKPDMVITVSEPIERILRGFGARKTALIMNCHSEVPIKPAQVEALREKHGTGDRPVVLYIGVLEPHRQLVEMARDYEKRRAGYVLIMGGYGTLEPEIKGLAENIDGLMFIGRVEPGDVPAYNRMSSILLAVYDPMLANNRLGAPNKLFEAMAAARPIIVADGTHAADIVERTGSGLTATYGTDEVLGAIDRLLADGELYERCAANGRTAFEREYNWPVMEKRLLAVYEELMR